MSEKKNNSPAYSMQDKQDIGFSKDKKKRKIKIFNILKLFFIISGLLFLASIVFIFSFIMGLDEWKDFDPGAIKNMQQSIVLYDSAGNEIHGLYSGTNRRYVSLDDIPDYVIDAFIATEDTRFYKHNGVDIVRIFGAILQDVKSFSYKQGASTISQQLVKNAYLTNEKSLSRKLQEAIMAVKLENYYSKDEVLEMYINYIYYGGGAYGIEAASQRYFGKSAKYLTLSESAILAGVVKAPSKYAPHIDMDKSKTRRNLILSLMLNQHMISSDEYNSAVSSDINLYPTDNSDFEFGYFTDLVLKESSVILNMDLESVLAGGYNIYTTIDSELQSYCQTLYSEKENFPSDGLNGEPCQSALIVLDSNTGAIRTCIGGREYTSKMCLNRATDMQRQPGSTIKPIMVYAPAVERNGYLPTSFVLDEVENFDGYIPKNFNNRTSGWVTLRQAVAKSLNIPAVRLLNEIGVEESKLFASNFGISFELEDKNLSLALGGFSKGVSPNDICSAYTAFANGGYYNGSYTISAIESPDGRIIYKKKQSGYSVISEQSSFLISSMLRTSVEEGTSKALNMENIELCAKTGTTEYEGIDGNRDAWITSYNSEYTMCCWMGFDKTTEKSSLDNKITGGSLPAKIVKQVFAHIYENKPAPTMEIPNGIVKVKLDSSALYKQKTPLLASTFTPNNKIIEDFFTDDTAPKSYSKIWDTPQTPNDLKVTKDEYGYPIISFTALSKNITYRLRRKTLTDDSDIIIATISNQSGTVECTDRLVIDNTTYLYYITATNEHNTDTSEVLSNNEKSASVIFEYTQKEKNIPKSKNKQNGNFKNDMTFNTEPDV